jgi:hypothetical protein
MVMLAAMRSIQFNLDLTVDGEKYRAFGRLREIHTATY